MTYIITEALGIAGDNDVILEGFKSSKNLKNGNSSVTDQCVSSLTNIDPDAIARPICELDGKFLGSDASSMRKFDRSEILSLRYFLGYFIAEGNFFLGNITAARK